jgi:hypothetical protein
MKNGISHINKEEAMQLKPVKTKKELGFPTINEFARNPELLYKNIPSSWLKNKYVAASLAMFVLCGNVGKSQLEKKENIDFVLQEKQNKENQKSKKIVKVAPVFAHGEGSGLTGCMAIAGPVFISEQEARTLIFDALKKEGIEVDTVDTPTISFSLPSKKKIDLKIDGFNKKFNLSIQYISGKDYKPFREYDTTENGFKKYYSTEGYSTKEAASIISSEMKKINKYNSGVFYDPLTKCEYRKVDGVNPCVIAKEESKELLLAQVQDFIQWLKDEGILEK